jgi:hypothetical protein
MAEPPIAASPERIRLRRWIYDNFGTYADSNVATASAFESGDEFLVIRNGELVKATYAQFGGAAAEFPSGTVMLFSQTSAPTGWTKDTSNFNAHALRVTTATANNGGADSWSTVFGQTVTGGTAITQAQLPNSTIPLTYSTAGFGAGGQTAVTAIAAGTALANDIDLSLGGSGNTHDHSLSMDLQFVEVIRATKD